MELNHFHINKLGTRPEAHGHSVTCLVYGGRRDFVHGCGTSRCHDCHFRVHHEHLACSHVGEHRSHYPSPLFGGQQIQTSGFFQNSDVSRKYLIGKTANNLNSRQIRHVHSTVEGLTGKGLLVDFPICVAIKKATNLHFQFMNC